MSHMTSKPKKPLSPTRTEILTLARDVLRRRSCGRIIEVSSARGNVRALLAEYRHYLAEAERLLERDGFRMTVAAAGLLKSEWCDTVSEYRWRATEAPLRHHLGAGPDL